MGRTELSRLVIVVEALKLVRSIELSLLLFVGVLNSKETEAKGSGLVNSASTKVH
jgi:hypothetical protein